jgi:regulatory factor X, other
MAAVLSTTGFDFSSSSQPLHSRSASMSSTSSPRSRPQSSHGPSQLGLRPSVDEYFAHSTSFANPEHARNNSDASHSSAYSLGSDLLTPADSPPNHNLANPALGKTLLRPTHIRARVAASPYPRDTESVHSSSSETEDMSMFLSHSAQDQYHSAQGFVNPHHPHPQPSHLSHHLSHHPHPHQHLAQQTMHVPGAFGSLPGPGAGGHGRMGMGAATDHTLEKLAANVRAATTTSASDRAKQIFVQAWCVFSWTFDYCQGSFFPRRLILTPPSFCLPFVLLLMCL